MTSKQLASVLAMAAAMLSAGNTARAGEDEPAPPSRNYYNPQFCEDYYYKGIPISSHGDLKNNPNLVNAYYEACDAFYENKPKAKPPIKIDSVNIQNEFAKPIFSFDQTINAKALELRVKPVKAGPYDCKYRIEVSLTRKGSLDPDMDPDREQERFLSVYGTFFKVKKGNLEYAKVLPIEKFIGKGNKGSFTGAGLAEFSCKPSAPPRGAKHKARSDKPVELDRQVNQPGQDSK